MESFADAPTTISYAFGCKCPAQRCSPGPIPDSLANPSYRIVCERDISCTCSGMKMEFESIFPQSGYLCNWVDINTGQKVTFGQVGTHHNQLQLHPLPVSWCACCPMASLF